MCTTQSSVGYNGNLPWNLSLIIVIIRILYFILHYSRTDGNQFSHVELGMSFYESIKPLVGSTFSASSLETYSAIEYHYCNSYNSFVAFMWICRVCTNNLAPVNPTIILSYFCLMRWEDKHTIMQIKDNLEMKWEQQSSYHYKTIVYLYTVDVTLQQYLSP